MKERVRHHPDIGGLPAYVGILPPSGLDHSVGVDALHDFGAVPAPDNVSLQQNDSVNSRLLQPTVQQRDQTDFGIAADLHRQDAVQSSQPLLVGVDGFKGVSVRPGVACHPDVSRACALQVRLQAAVVSIGQGTILMVRPDTGSGDLMKS